MRYPPARLLAALTAALALAAAGLAAADDPAPADDYLAAVYAHAATGEALADAQAAEAEALAALTAARATTAERLAAHKAAAKTLAAATAALPEGEPLPTTTTTTTAPPAIAGQPDRWPTDSIHAAYAVAAEAGPLTVQQYLLAARQLTALANAVTLGIPSTGLPLIAGHLADPEHIHHDQARQWLHLAHRLAQTLPAWETLRCYAAAHRATESLGESARLLVGDRLPAEIVYQLSRPILDPDTPYLATLAATAPLMAAWPDGPHADHCQDAPRPA